jgi:serine/threonine protein kinase
VADTRQASSGQFPRQFGKYVLVEPIAEGGMAEIFRAKTVGAEGFEKEVAIKRILPGMSQDESFVNMFRDEALIASRLKHPNIVEVSDFDLAEGCYYLAMEYVEGKDLRQIANASRKAGTPPSPALCTAIAVEVCKGLSYAHTRTYKGKPLNIVHRDVTPHNVMVSYNGEVKLMDFGIAKAAMRSTQTQAGLVKGKVSYMSPEQARGLELDGRSDVFALGIVLWEFLTGERLFEGDSDVAVLTAIVSEDTAAPSAYNQAVAPELDRIVLKALAKERDQRYPNATAFQQDLTRFLYANLADPEEINLSAFMRGLFREDLHHLLQRQAKESTLKPEDFRQAGITPESVARAPEPSSSIGTPPPLPQPQPPTRPEVFRAEPSRVTGRDRQPSSLIAREGSTARRAPRASWPWIGLALVLGLACWAGAAVFMLNNGDQPAAGPEVSQPVAAEAGGAADDPGAGPDAPTAAGAGEATPSAVMEVITAPEAAAAAGEASAPEAPAPAVEPPTAGGANRPAVGWLTLNARPYAKVYWHGQDLGNTPIIDREFPAGTQTLILKKDGQRRRVEVTVRAGAHVTKSVEME